MSPGLLPLHLGLQVAPFGAPIAGAGAGFPLAFVAAAVLAAMLGLLALVTVGRSLLRDRHERRRTAVRGDLRAGLLERVYARENPDWQGWVGGLSGLEREVLERLLEEYLRELDGSDAATLAALGRALGLDDRARRDLETGDMYDRLAALTWLALLRDPPDSSVLERQCTGTARERAAAARVLYASDHPDTATTGVQLLLGEQTGSFSVFGIDTLYQVLEADPTPLFDRAASAATDWDPALQAQVLLVTREVSTVTGGADLTWMLDLLSSPAERTRVEAARALGGYGWKQTLRDRLDLEAVRTDPSPLVRASGYRMLGEWGDEAAVRTLESAAAAESDERARVVAAESLLPYRDRYDLTVPDGLRAAWAWAEAHATFDDRARDIQSSGAG